MTAVDDSKTNADGRRLADEAELREKAARRSWICPGAGFALVGARAYAITTFIASLCIIPVIAWLALQPATASFWATVAVLVIATALWIIEQIAVKNTVLRTPSPTILNSGFVAVSCLMWLAGMLAVGLLVTAIGSLRMAGTGMAPTLEEAERVIYHKHVDKQAVRPGAVVVYKNSDDSAWGEPGWLLISRILAGPGDSIAIENAKYVVNGVAGPPVAGTGKYRVALDVPSSPDSLTIPAGCYFIVQDSPKGGFDSRVLSWARADNVIGSRLWYLSSRGICKPVE